MTDTPTYAFAAQDARPVIFLDLDHVLITPRATAGAGEGAGMGEMFDPVAIKLLNKLCALSGAQLVLSTSHRDLPEIREILKANGVTGEFHADYKTDSGAGPRGAQIQRWLDAHPEVKRYSILDDLDKAHFLPQQHAHFVQTPKNDGLSYQNFLDVLRIFAIKPPAKTIKFRYPPAPGV